MYEYVLRFTCSFDLALQIQTEILTLLKTGDFVSDIIVNSLAIKRSQYGNDKYEYVFRLSLFGPKKLIHSFSIMANDLLLDQGSVDPSYALLREDITQKDTDYSNQVRLDYSQISEVIE